MKKFMFIGLCTLILLCSIVISGNAKVQVEKVKYDKDDKRLEKDKLLDKYKELDKTKDKDVYKCKKTTEEPYTIRECHEEIKNK